MGFSLSRSDRSSAKEFRVGNFVEFVSKKGVTELGTITGTNSDGSFDIRVGGVLGANTRNGRSRMIIGGTSHANIVAGKITRKVR